MLTLLPAAKVRRLLNVIVDEKVASAFFDAINDDYDASMISVRVKFVRNP